MRRSARPRWRRSPPRRHASNPCSSLLPSRFRTAATEDGRAALTRAPAEACVRPPEEAPGRRARVAGREDLVYCGTTPPPPPPPPPPGTQTLLADDFEAARGWTVNAQGTDKA